MNLNNIATLGSTAIIQQYINGRLKAVFKDHADKCKDFFTNDQFLTIGNADGTLDTFPVKMAAAFHYQRTLNSLYGHPDANPGVTKYNDARFGTLTITAETKQFGIVTMNGSVTKNGEILSINYTTNNMCGSLRLDTALELLDLLEATDIFSSVTLKVVDDGTNDPTITV